MADDIEYNDKGLKNLIKALSAGNIPKARVGVLGDKNARENSGSNASIGAKHEFGEDGLPVRSFLRMPLIDKLSHFLEESGFFNKDVAAQVVKAGSIEAWIEKIGIVGVKVVLEAFDTGGFGKWVPSNMKYKKNHQTLVETQQLRNSITYEVK